MKGRGGGEVGREKRESEAYFVVLRRKVSACSGMPYTCSTPGKEISMATALGPVRGKRAHQPVVLTHHTLTTHHMAWSLCGF